MFLKANYTTFVVLMVALHTFNIDAYPDSYQRLIRTDQNGNIIKVVDLIGDTHEERADRICNLEAHHKISASIPKNMCLSERMLIQTLYDISRQRKKRPVELIIESSPRIKEGVENSTQSLWYLGKNLKSTKNLLVTDSDIFRWALVGSEENFNTIFNDSQLEDLLAYEEPVENDIKKYLARNKKVKQAIQQILFHSSFELNKMQFINRKYNKAVANLFDNKDQQNLNKQKQQFIRKAKTILKKHKQWGQPFQINSLTSIVNALLDFYVFWEMPVADFEFLLNILKSKNKHIIVYAGSYHTNNISTTLINHFGYKKIIAVPKKYIPKAITWQLLKTGAPASNFFARNMKRNQPLIPQQAINIFNSMKQKQKTSPKRTPARKTPPKTRVSEKKFQPQQSTFKKQTLFQQYPRRPIHLSSYSIDDYIAEHGQPHITQEGGLHLVRKNLTSLRGLNKIDNIKKVKALYLDGNQLTTIQPGAFKKLTSLQTLHLNNNKLTTIQPGAFEGLSSLQELRLTFNPLTTIQAGAFDGLSSLQDLFLEYNKLTTIPTGALKGLVLLKFINLEENRLKPKEKEKIKETIKKIAPQAKILI